MNLVNGNKKIWYPGIFPDHDNSNDFANGMFILPFDVTPTSAANVEYLSKYEGGHCRIEL